MTEHDPIASVPTIELVQRTQGGEAEACEELFQRYGTRVRQIVRMRLGNKLRQRLDSMDITQDVLGDAFANLGEFEMRDESSLIRWMSRIAENRIRNHADFQNAEKRDASREVALDAPRPGTSAPLEIAGGLPTPSIEVGRAEEVDLVRASISELPDRYREVVLLRDYTGASWDDVAKEIGVATPGAAHMLYSRALTKLSEILQRRGIE